MRLSTERDVGFSAEFPGSSEGRRQAVWLVASALVTAALFASGGLDVAVARCFYYAGGADHWPLARQLPWTLLYRAASWITAALVIAGLAALTVSFAPCRRHWRRAAMLILLAVAIGPGLLGNALFKDHWQHPRPRELAVFGGTAHYVPAPLIGREGGASFPCGHCTVGFLYACGWWLWRHRRQRWARSSLAAGLLLGALLGVGRMAAGAHFLSDVIWSALLACAVTHVLYYHVLRFPAADQRAGEAPAAGGGIRSWPTVAALASGAAVLMALFTTPHGTLLNRSVALGSLAGGVRILEVEADRANVTVVLVDGPATQLDIAGELHGFGLPGSRLDAQAQVLSQPLPTLRYRIEERGWLTDVDGFASLRVPASAFAQLRVLVHDGNIVLIDTTRAQVAAGKTMRLDLRAPRGRVEIRSAATRPCDPGSACR